MEAASLSEPPLWRRQRILAMDVLQWRRHSKGRPMKSAAVLIALLTVLVAPAGTAVVPVSDLSGIHAVIEKVVFEPNEGAPERVQIWGAFVLATAGPAAPPQRGYLYLGLPPIVMECTTCPPPSAATENAKREWADLKS